MKIRIPTAKLLDAVGHAASVASSKSPKPVLECVALHVDPTTGVMLEATDLDVGVRIHLPDAEVDEGGTVVVPATRLLSVVREIESEEIELVEDDGSVVVETEASRFRIRGEDPEGLSRIPAFPEKGSVVVPGDLLREMIQRTVFATAKEAGRYALHGVLFRLQGDTLELVATDGRRLARVTRSLEKKAGKDLKVIVGPKGLSLLDRILGAEPQDVAIALQERQVLFQVGGTLIVSRLIDGSFPAYDDVIPKKTKAGFSIGVADFASSLRRASILTTRDSMSVQFEVRPRMLTIRSRAPEVGEARIEVPIEYDGPETDLGFNPAFLSDALKVLDPEGDVAFSFTDAKSPGKLTDGDDYVYVVMPIALE